MRSTRGKRRRRETLQVFGSLWALVRRVTFTTGSTANSEGTEVHARTHAEGERERERKEKKKKRSGGKVKRNKPTKTNTEHRGENAHPSGLGTQKQPK